MTVGYRRNKRGNQRFLEANEHENITSQNLSDTVKTVLRGIFIAMSTYINKDIFT
jgi:hypothetical protein